MNLFDLLSCAALEPGLNGILFIDFDPSLLRGYAEALAVGIEAVEGRTPLPVTLGAWTSEEDLWPHWGLTVEDGAVTFSERPGLLSEQPGVAVPLVVIPDLARVGTAVTRAAVSSIGADVVHVERHDVSARWKPTARWLAACARRDIPALSPHLLDRFPVRWDGANARPADGSLADSLREHLPSIARHEQPRQRPEFTESAVKVVLGADTGVASIRRSLALGRAARAVAERRRHPAVTRDDVIEAGELLGLARTNPPRPAGARRARPPDHVRADPDGVCGRPRRTDRQAGHGRG